MATRVLRFRSIIGLILDTGYGWLYPRQIKDHNIVRYLKIFYVIWRGFYGNLYVTVSEVCGGPPKIFYNLIGYSYLNLIILKCIMHYTVYKSKPSIISGIIIVLKNNILCLFAVNVKKNVHLFVYIIFIANR